jgi:hypothetical protein
MDSWKKRLDVAVNIAILGAFLMVAALAAQRLWGPRESAHPSVGAKVSVTGIDWSKSDKNLVLALSTTCHFCSDSANFYQRLVPAATKSGIPTFAVLPQPLLSSEPYVKNLGLTVSVLQSPLDTVDVTGTPTVLLVDAKGKISKAWVGKLSDEREKEVVESLQ